MTFTERRDTSTALCLAIAECERDDAAFLMEGILTQMRAGMPVAYFNSLRDEAESWAALSTRHELKAYLWAIWRALPESDRRAFLKQAEKMR